MMRSSIRILPAVLVLLCLGLGVVANVVHVEDLIKNKRLGLQVWGDWYDIPNVGGARAWTYNEYGKNGRPISSGIKLTSQFLQNIHKAPCHYFTSEKGLEKSCMFETWLDMTFGAPFNFVGLSFASGGHGPVGVYNKPHFDVHFYLDDQYYINKFMNPGNPKTRGLCPLGFDAKTFRLYNRPIPSKCYPKGFSNVGAASPLMGNHLINLNAPEFQKGGEFNATWVWGSFAGRVHFFEPMITLETFLSKKAFCGPIPSLPKEFPKAGYYPTTWCYYSYHNGDSYVELRDYTWKQAGCKNANSFDGYLHADPATLPKQCSFVRDPKTKPAVKHTKQAHPHGPAVEPPHHHHKGDKHPNMPKHGGSKTGPKGPKTLPKGPKAVTHKSPHHAGHPHTPKGPKTHPKGPKAVTHKSPHHAVHPNTPKGPKTVPPKHSSPKAPSKPKAVSHRSPTQRIVIRRRPSPKQRHH